MSLTRIKFCGFTRAEDIAVAVELGVDFIGLVFASYSPRRLALDKARELRALIPVHVKTVALCMDHNLREVSAIVDAVQPDILQFHGDEPDVFAVQFGLPYWKAIAMGEICANVTEKDVAYELTAWPNASAFLLDGHGAGEQGGSGKSFDWSKMPQSTDKQPLLLAGGLNAGNVQHALHIAKPWGVDVSSGIESAPGVKDAAKMRAFVEAVKFG